ncbi:hypothetical protein L3Q82_023645, partial [Scortum barcoo]
MQNQAPAPVVQRPGRAQPEMATWARLPVGSPPTERSMRGWCNVVWVAVVAGGPRRLNPWTKTLFLKHCSKLSCKRSVQSMLGRQASTSGDVEEAVGGQQPSSRTATSAFVQGGTGGALPEPCKMTSSRPQMCMCLLKRSETDSMRARCPQVGVVLTAQHRAGRLVFAREHQDWQIHHWRPVLFTDESRFTLSTCDRRDRVWRRRGGTFCCLQHSSSMTGLAVGSVMVWDGISLGGRTALHVLARGSLTAIRYRDEILRPLVRPYAGAVGPGFLLMQDNARPHVAGVCQQFLQDEGIDAMDWPARSPDLNPIEAHLGHHVLAPSTNATLHHRLSR